MVGEKGGAAVLKFKGLDNTYRFLGLPKDKTIELFETYILLQTHTEYTEGTAVTFALIERGGLK